MLCAISRRVCYNRWAVFFFPHIFWRYCWHRIVFIYLINEKHTFLRWTYWYKTLGNLSHPPPLSHTLVLLRWLHFWWPRIRHVLVPEFSSDHALIPDAWIWDLFHFPIFVVFKTVISPLVKVCLNSWVYFWLPCRLSPAGLRLSHFIVSTCLFTLNLHFFHILPPSYSFSPFTAVCGCYRRNPWDILSESHVMLEEEVLTRAVPDMVAGEADAGENYFCFQDCRTHIYIWVKDGRDVLHFWIPGNKLLRHSPVISWVLVSASASNCLLDYRRLKTTGSRYPSAMKM